MQTTTHNVTPKVEELYTNYDLVDFLNRYYGDSLNEIAQKPRKSDLWVSQSELLKFDMDLADIVSGEYERYTASDLATAFSHVLPDCNFSLPRDILPGEITIRFHDFNKEELFDVGEYWADEHLGQYIGVRGQISKSTEKRVYYTQRVFLCQDCGAANIIPQIEGEYQEAYECGECEMANGFTETKDHPEVEAIDYKRLKIKQPADERDGDNSERLVVEVKGDLLKWLESQRIEAGTRVVVYGTLESEERNNSEKPILKAHAIETQDNDLNNLEPEPEERKKIEAFANGEYGDPFKLLAESVAPSIMGVDKVEDIEYDGEEQSKMWWFKLGAALAGLFQGFRKEADGDPYRGTSHVLAVGDPSTGKSTVLDWVGDVSPRSASTSGKGATAAGLTAAAVQDNLGDGNRWTLEAGVLVQANGGVAVVDELDKMDKEAVSSMHGALERQRVEVSKAGINATLRAETALLAAGNPKDSRFSGYAHKHEEIDLVGSLIDRFDLIFIIEDKNYKERDKEIGTHIIDSWTESAKIETGEISAEDSEIASEIPTDLLRKWVALSRSIYPRIQDQDVKERISDFYVSIRSQNDSEDMDGTEPIPATTRSLEGLLRLSEAIARVELSEEIAMRHAELAISLVKASLNDIGYDEETGQYDIDRLSDNKSATNRDIDSRLRGIITELSNGEAADRENVFETLESAGVDREKIEHRYSKLKDRGEIYEPSNGKARLT